MTQPEAKYKLLSKENNEEEEEEILYTFRKRSTSIATNKHTKRCSSKQLSVTIMVSLVLLYVLILVQAFFTNTKEAWVKPQGYGATNHTHHRSVYDWLSYFGTKIGVYTHNETNANEETAEDELQNEIPLRIQLNNAETYLQTEQESNIAATYWDRWTRLAVDSEPSVTGPLYCPTVQLTNPFELRHNNLLWQRFDANTNGATKVGNKSGNITLDETIHMYLFNAYYDQRLAEKPLVRLITANNQHLMADKIKWWCLLWFENVRHPVLVNVSDFYYIWPPNWKDANPYGYFHPQLISCPVPKQFGHERPQAVSLQARGECGQVQQQPSNVLRVVYNREREHRYRQPSIGVCVQALRFGAYDVSVRLVEWLEMIRVLGADKVYLYVYGSNDNIASVLRHYTADGLVDWRPLTLPGKQVNVNSLYNLLASHYFKHFWPIESLELNDCLYRNLNRHDYLAVIDVDELIMPQTVNTWHQLIALIQNGLSETERKRKAYYSSRHTHVCEQFEESQYQNESTGKTVSIGEHLYLMRHTSRAQVLSPRLNNKCLHRTDQVMAVHNHFPMRCLGTQGHLSCSGVDLKPTESLLMHYRRSRAKDSQEKSKSPDQCSIRDRTTWRYFEQISLVVRRQLKNIFVV